MKINDYEKLGLGIILKNPNGTQNIPQRVVSELEPERFNSNPHKQIYLAIKRLVMKKEVPNTMNVSLELGDQLDNCGGLEYLSSLVTFPDLAGITDFDSLKQWIEVIDKAGRLRHLGDVIDSYKGRYSDFENLVSKVDDVDLFLSNFMSEINEGAKSIRTNYKPISDACEIEKRHATLEGDGFTTDIIKCGMPKLANYMIPRPFSLGSIMGESSMGKTSLGLEVILGCAINLYKTSQPGVVSINSLETIDRKLVRLMACIYSSTDSMQLAHGTISPSQFKKYMEAVEFIAQLPIRYNDNPDLTTDELSWHAIAQDYLEKRVLGISDYAELFKDAGQSEELRVSSIVRNHRRIAWRVGSCEVLLSQVTSNSATKWATLRDARYTRSFEQALDWGIIIYNPVQMIRRGIDFVQHRDTNSDRAYWSIQKNKGYDVGIEAVSWQPEYSRFIDMALPMNQLYQFEREDEF